jgi:PilZ domain
VDIVTRTATEIVTRRLNPAGFSRPIGTNHGGSGLIPYSKVRKAMFFRGQKRTERRMKRDFPARVMLGGFAKRDCKVVDISESGARIVLSSAIELPRQFSIAFASSERPCQLVWRNGTMAGVKFLK